MGNEVCVYEYEQASEQTFVAEGHHSDAKTVEVVFVEKSDTQMVTVCQPGYGGYGHGGYGHGGCGHQYCNEVAQTTQYNVPTVPAVDVDVKVAYPAPKKVCVDKPIDLPRVTCEDLSEEKCIQVPEIENPPSLLTNVPMLWARLPAKPLSLPSPSKSVLSLSMDTLMKNTSTSQPQLQLTQPHTLKKHLKLSPHKLVQLIPTQLIY